MKQESQVRREAESKLNNQTLLEWSTKLIMTASPMY